MKTLLITWSSQRPHFWTPIIKTLIKYSGFDTHSFLRQKHGGSLFACQNKKDTLSVVVQLLSWVELFVTPWTSAHQFPLSSTVSQSLCKFMSIESLMLSNHLTLSSSVLCSSVSTSLQFLGPTMVLCPWDFPGLDTGVGFHSLLQRIFQMQESNLGLLRCRQIFYHLGHQGSPCATTPLLSVISPHGHSHYALHRGGYRHVART